MNEFNIPTMPTTTQIKEAAAQPPALADSNESRALKLEEAWREAGRFTTGVDAAKILRRAARENMSPDEIVAAPDFVSQDRLGPKDLQRLALRYPHTADILADPWLVSAFGNPDDVKALGRLENVMGGIRGVAGGAASIVPKAVGNINKLSWDVLGYGAGQVENLADFTGLDFLEGAAKWAREGVQGYSRDQAAFIQNPRWNLPDELRGDIAEHPEYLLSPTYWSYQTGDALASMAPALLAAYATANPLLAVQAAVGGAVGGAQEGAALYTDLMTEGKGSNANALTAATGMAVGSGALNTLSFGKIFGALPSGIRRKFLDIAQTAVTEGATEWAENPLQAFLSGLARGDDKTRITDGVLKAAKDLNVIPGALLAGGGARALNLWIEAAAQAENAQTENLVKLAADAARNSEAMLAAPEIAGKIIERLAREQGAPQSFYIDAEVLETFRQEAFEEFGLDMAGFEDTFLEPMGLTAEEYREALDTGVSLELPIAGIPRVAESPVWQSIEKTEGVIRAEPQNITETRLEDDPFADVELPPDVTDKTRADLEERLIEAGRNRKEAGALAEFFSRGAVNTLKSVGLDPNKWLRNLQFAKANGQSGTTSYNQPAMYRAYSETVTDFIQEAKQTDPQGKKPFFDFDNSFGDTVIILGADQVKHIADGHPDFAEWERIPEVIERGQAVQAGPNQVTGGDSVIYTLEDNGSTLVVVAAPNTGGSGRRRKTPRTMVLTAFRDSTAGVKTWLANNKAASSSSVRPSHPDPDSHDVIPSSSGSGKNHDRLPSTSGAASRGEVGRPEAHQDSAISIVQNHPGVKPDITFEQSPRGRLDILNDGNFLIVFEEAADASTAIHESAHLFLEQMRHVLASSPDMVVDWDAFNQLNEDVRALAEWAGQGDPYGQWSVESHEKVARGLETYMMEGKAPVPALERLFKLIKGWIEDIYRSIKKLNAPLNDDVRDVFDRLLAADHEIALDGWRTREPEGLPPEIQAELAAPRQEASTAVEAAIRQKRLAEVNNMKSQWWKEGAIEAAMNPHQMMLDEIIKGGGIKLASLKTTYAAEDIAALNRKRPGLVNSRGTVGFDEYAARYGYGGDSDAFIQSLKDAPSRTRLIADYVAEQESYYAQYLAADAPITDAEINLAILEAEALRLKHNAKEAVRVLRETKKALAKNGGKSRLKRAIMQNTGLKSVDELSRKNMADLKASLRLEMRAAARGERAGALAKRVEMAIKYKAEREAKNFIAKNKGKWKRFVNQKPASPTAVREGGVDAAFAIQAKQLLHQFGFSIGEAGLREVDGAANFSTFVAEQEQNGNEIYAPDWIVKGQRPLNPSGKPKTIGQLTLEQFTDVANTIDSLLHVGRESQKMLASANKMTFDEAAAKIVQSVQDNVPQAKDRGPGPESHASKLVSTYTGELRKAEYIIREFDGLKTMGPVWGILYQPNKAASDAEINLGEKMVGAIKDAWAEFTPKQKQAMGTSPMRERLNKLAEKAWLPVPDAWRTIRHTFEGAPKSLTEAEIVSVFANMGNPYNMERLVKGNGFTVESLAEIANYVMARPKLHQATMKMVAAIDGLFDPLADVHFKSQGVKLEKVDPGEITLPNGTKTQGWYYPVAYDPDKSNMAYQQGQASAAKENMAAMGYGRRSARSGSSHQRAGAVAALSLSLDVIGEHVKDTVHDITHRLAVRDVQRLLNRDDVREAIISRDNGQSNYEQLQSWINWVAKPKSPAMQGWMQGLDWLRRNVVTATLAFNISTPIMQFLGFTQTVDFIGFKATYDGVRTLTHNPAATIEFVRKHSPEVRGRDQGFDQDMRDIIGGFDSDAGIMANEREAFVKAGFWAIKQCDRLVAYATWQGAYDKAIREGRDHQYACEYADTTVRMTQPLALPKDTAAIQRHPLGKVFAMYYTFFSGFHNRLVERYRGVFKTGKLPPAALMATVLWTIIIPNALTYLYQHEDAPDEPEEIKGFVFDMAAYTATGLPIVRDLLGAVLSDYPYQITPLNQAGQSLSRAAKSKKPETAAKQSVRVAGYLFGLPTNQALRTWDGLWKMLDGETGNPVRLFKPEPKEE